jgi:ribosomal protein L37AE/L43A
MGQMWDNSEAFHCDNCKSLLTRIRCDVWHCHLCGTLQTLLEPPITPTLVSSMVDKSNQCLRGDRGQCAVYELARQAAGWLEP